MGKLGKKARKFAKKHLQSVLKRRRKMNSTLKRKRTSRDKGDVAEGQVGKAEVMSNGRNPVESMEDLSLDHIFDDNDNNAIEDGSDSDGFLLEDSSYICPVGSEEEYDADEIGSSLFKQNKEIHLELAKQKRKLDKLIEKDPEFSKFLESHSDDFEQSRREETFSDVEGEISDQEMMIAMEDGSNLRTEKVLSYSTIDSWCQLITEEQKFSVLPNLLDAYRIACHYGSDDGIIAVSSQRTQNTEVLCKIILFMLHEASSIFHSLLGISTSSCKVETILDMKKTSKWQNARPLIKSYLRSTLFLLNQVTDSEILVFALTQLRAAIVFFSGFPSLLQRLIEVTVHLWSTGDGLVSSSSFLVICNIALLFSSDVHDTCLIKAYKAFIAHCKFVGPNNLEQLNVLMNSLVELYSVDVAKSYSKLLVSIRQLAKILQQGLKTKDKEVLKRICNWQYINCINLWVKFISSNCRDHDLQALLYLIIQVINGIANLFPGLRFLPLRLKCIQMLNQLSTSTGVFIPITSHVLDSLEYIKSCKLDARLDGKLDMSSMLKVPKQWLRVQYFQEELVLSAIEQLSIHFNQWGYHISFPDLATIPLIRLRKFHENITAESLRRPVKRMIDQVEQNMEFIQKKRDEVVFSPKDQDNVESFFQVNRSSSNAPFTQYYTSIIQNSLSRNALVKKRVLEKEESKKQQQFHDNGGGETMNMKKYTSNGKKDSTVQTSDGRKRKKQRT